MSEAGATPRAAKAARYGFVFAFPFVMVMLLVGIYVSAMHAPKPHDLPVAVVGSGAQAERSVAALDAADGSPVDARLLRSVDEAKRQLHDREIAGALVLPNNSDSSDTSDTSVNSGNSGSDGNGGTTAQLWTAQAAGASQTMTVSQLLTPVAAASHLTVEAHDVAPLPQDDQSGMGVLYLSVGAMLAGYMAVTVASSGMPRLLRLKKLVPVLAGWSALMSVVIWTLAGPVIGAVSGHAPEVLGTAFLGIFAVGLTQAFLTRLFGPIAVIPGITLFMFLGVPASNLALSIHTMPGFFGFLHHVLPLPAVGEALRAIVYFDGDGAGVHLLTLGIWALAALLLTAGVDLLKRRKADGKTDGTGTDATTGEDAAGTPGAPAARKAPHPAVQYVMLGAFPFLMVVLMVGLMLSGMHKPLPRDLPVAVVADSAQAAEQTAQGLEKSLGSSFDIRPLTSADEAKRQIRDRGIAGAYVLPAPGEKAQILSAGGAGMSQQQVVQRTFGQIAAQQGVRTENIDLAPLPAHDGMGTVTLYLAIGLHDVRLHRRHDHVRRRARTPAGTQAAPRARGMGRAHGHGGVAARGTCHRGRARARVADSRPRRAHGLHGLARHGGLRPLPRPARRDPRRDAHDVPRRARLERRRRAPHGPGLLPGPARSAAAARRRRGDPLGPLLRRRRHRRPPRHARALGRRGPRAQRRARPLPAPPRPRQGPDGPGGTRRGRTRPRGERGGAPVSGAARARPVRAG